VSILLTYERLHPNLLSPSLLRKGTSIRRTNETDMNAQSSRSHAIFSLTLTQKKYTGSGAPPRTSSPLPPGGRSPSRLARPGSMYASPTGSGTRVSSPTFGGRPSTPSFASAMGRGGGLRPSSALGHAGERSNGGGEDDGGEWVTIVSKFHFVDLAGSERVCIVFLLSSTTVKLNTATAQTHSCGWRTHQRGYFNQQRPSCLGQRHFRLRGSFSGEIPHSNSRPIP
jgi:hypothetical protein